MATSKINDEQAAGAAFPAVNDSPPKTPEEEPQWIIDRERIMTICKRMVDAGEEGDFTRAMPYMALVPKEIVGSDADAEIYRAMMGDEARLSLIESGASQMEVEQSISAKRKLTESMKKNDEDLLQRKRSNIGQGTRKHTWDISKPSMGLVSTPTDIKLATQFYKKSTFSVQKLYKKVLVFADTEEQVAGIMAQCCVGGVSTPGEKRILDVAALLEREPIGETLAINAFVCDPTYDNYVLFLSKDQDHYVHITSDYTVKNTAILHLVPFRASEAMRHIHALDLYHGHATNRLEVFIDEALPLSLDNLKEGQIMAVNHGYYGVQGFK